MRLRRSALAIALMIAATGAGIAAASVVVAPRGSFEQEPDRLLPGPAELLIGARTPDAPGLPDWAVRTYVSRTGLLCAERGRASGAVFGDLDADGDFEPRPAGPTGVCGDVRVERVVAAVDRVAARDGRPPVTFVYGASLQRPSAAVVSPEGGTPVSLPLGSRGTFIGRFEGLRTPQSLPLSVIFDDGRTEEITWSDAAGGG